MTAAGVAGISCVTFVSIWLFLWWDEKHEKKSEDETKVKCNVTPVYVTAAIREQLDQADTWKALALAMDTLHCHIANRTEVPERLRDNIREWKFELGVRQWED